MANTSYFIIICVFDFLLGQYANPTLSLSLSLSLFVCVSVCLSVCLSSGKYTPPHPSSFSLDSGGWVQCLVNRPPVSRCLVDSTPHSRLRLRVVNAVSSPSAESRNELRPSRIPRNRRQIFRLWMSWLLVVLYCSAVATDMWVGLCANIFTVEK